MINQETIKIDYALGVFCKAYGVDKKLLTGKSRLDYYARKRHCIAHLLKVNGHITQQRIKEALNRHWSTVRNSEKVVNPVLTNPNTDPELYEDYKTAYKAILDNDIQFLMAS